MRGRSLKIAFAIVAVLMFVAASFAFAAGDKCPLCGMNMAGNENTAYEITLKDNKTMTYCCPHCGLWEQASAKDRVASARARDFISGEWMDVSKMVFLSDSKAVPACAPSWIAFGDQGEAKKFKKGFGGKIFSYDQALTERMKQNKNMK